MFLRVFQGVFFILWLSVAIITFVAVRDYGFAAAGDAFSNGFAAMDWQAQFNIELLAYMFLVAVWLAWRSAFSPLGILLGVLCFTVGATFSILFIITLTIYHRGDMQKVVMGSQAQ